MVGKTLDGVIGPVRAYFGAVEEQGRRTLHLHMMVWLMTPPDVRQLQVLLNDPEWRCRFFRFFDIVIKEGFEDVSQDADVSEPSSPIVADVGASNVVANSDVDVASVTSETFDNNNTSETLVHSDVIIEMENPSR